MAHDVKLYWRKQCSTCRNARAFIEERDARITERDFFRQPLSEAELRQLIGDRTVDNVFSWKSPSARALGLKQGEEPPEKLIELMVNEPRLIRRPIVVVGGETVIGFDKKRLDELLV
jgi:Spx/MgsR family transcriptional regulator